DHQVKIRGFRIELGEIETRLAACEGVREAAVLARQDAGADKRLVGYVTGEGIEISRLRAALAGELPEYMVPSAFVVLEAFPLTAHGKLDREALPAPDQQAVPASAYEAPRGELEAAIAAIWCELLGRDQVGRDDHFFELGGHSLLAVQLMARIDKVLAIEVPLRTLFAAPVLADFAQHIGGRRLGEESTSLVTIRGQGRQLPLFLVHPGEGEVDYARRLAAVLDSDLPVYGLAASGFLRGEPARQSVEEIAHHYVREIQRVQPHGPYRIAGWSIGGTIAFEICHQLLGADESVEFLGVMDTLANYRDKLRDARQLVDPAWYLYHAAVEQLPAKTVKPMVAMRDAGDLDAMLETCQHAGLFPAEVDIDVLHRHLAVRHGLARAVWNYVAPVLPLPFTLFAAREQKRDDRTLGWGARHGAALRQCTVPGDHRSMMEEGHIDALGTAITAALVDAAGQCMTAPAHQPLVLIQRGRAGRVPLFCMPGAGASVTSFAQLTQALGPDQPVYGLQARGLCGTQVPYSSVEAAARAYVRAIEEIVPSGPVHLLGHSFGGWIAAEMARQLEAIGRPPASLFILDSRGPRDKDDVHYHTPTEALERLVSLYDLTVDKPLGLSARDFEPLGERERLELLRKRLIERRVLPARTDLTLLRGVAQVFFANINTSWCPPTGYARPVHVVVANAVSRSGPADAERDHAEVARRWRDYAPQLQLWHAPGNHLTLLSAPHVQALAEHIGPLLRDAFESSRSI
ncbi:alpha/beta fold hydrolase, partial [Paucibacter sp. APW11]